MTTINLKKLLPYIGIFFVLLMGSGLVKIPVGSVWFYIIKFGIILGVLGIGVWTWYKAKVNNQPPTDYLKLALFVPFTIDFHLHYAFIFLTIILFNKKLLLPWNSPLKPIYLLFIWGFISYVVNQFIEFNPLSFPLFAITFFLPFVFLGLFYNSTRQIEIDKLIMYFYTLIGLVIIILLFQTVIFWHLHPDLRNGGLKNAHVAGTFISLAIILIYFRFCRNLKSITHTNKYVFFLLGGFILLFLIDAKYIIVVLLISIFVSEIIFNFRISRIKYTLIIVFITATSIYMYASNQKIILSILSINDQNFRIHDVVKEFEESPRGQLLTEGFYLPTKDPKLFLFGSGPGTFLSRTARLRLHYKYFGWSEYTAFRTLIPASFISELTTETWVQKKYLSDIDLNKFYASSIYEPNGGIISFYFEYGLVGIVILGIILFKIAMKGMRLDQYRIIFSLVVFSYLIYLFGNWLETTSFQLLCFSLIGLKIVEGTEVNDTMVVHNFRNTH